MSKTCPVPTPAERKYGEIHSKIQTAMLQKVYAAIQDAADQARREVQTAGLDMEPPASEYLSAIVHQNIYCTLCKADPETYAGGCADIAISIIRNSQNIAKHYWGADIEPYPRPQSPEAH